MLPIAMRITYMLCFTIAVFAYIALLNEKEQLKNRINGFVLMEHTFVTVLLKADALRNGQTDDMYHKQCERSRKPIHKRVSLYLSIDMVLCTFPFYLIIDMVMRYKLHAYLDNHINSQNE